jgi:hypothetical protein
LCGQWRTICARDKEIRNSGKATTPISRKSDARRYRIQFLTLINFEGALFLLSTRCKKPACRHHVATEYGESRGAAAYRTIPSLPCQPDRLQRANSGIAMAFAPSEVPTFMQASDPSSKLPAAAP